MPFCKKDKKKPAYPVQQPAYPVQSYPTQPTYTTQQIYTPQQPYPTQQVYHQHQGTFQPVVLPQGAQGMGYPQQSQAGAMPPAGPPPPYTPQAQVYPPQPMPAPSTVVVQGGFDAGARNPTSIPPPPPGYAPNSAQLASTQGQNVVVSQRPSNWMTGGSDGGYVVW
ncbi:DAZ-associated protein 2-like [Anneissia japonica]|uniref:DAZ-associated protein 2-like n=1 Tax=Anneissia japonica TaxID=1529436 RepID=UPI001425A589|nr:DAZ-associated protein 2-like [Anneissia japonica]